MATFLPISALPVTSSPELRGRDPMTSSPHVSISLKTVQEHACLGAARLQCRGFPALPRAFGNSCRRRESIALLCGGGTSPHGVLLTGSLLVGGADITLRLSDAFLERGTIQKGLPCPRPEGSEASSRSRDRHTLGTSGQSLTHQALWRAF